MARDNISGAEGRGFFLTIFLIPGRFIQWFMYIFIGGTKGYSNVRQQTRMARSPILTYVFSILSWVGIVGYIYVSKTEGNWYWILQ
jgi:hypothetical protein